MTGAVLANVMFAADPVSISTTHRATVAHGVSEVVATVGLLLVIFALVRSGRAALLLLRVLYPSREGEHSERRSPVPDHR